MGSDDSHYEYSLYFIPSVAAVRVVILIIPTYSACQASLFASPAGLKYACSQGCFSATLSISGLDDPWLPSACQLPRRDVRSVSL